jgi:hypothetical protein
MRIENHSEIYITLAGKADIDYGRRFSGSGNNLTSVANSEVFTNLENANGYYSFSLQVFTDCHISVNGVAFIFLSSNTTFETDLNDVPVKSLKFKENNVQCLWISAY